MSEQCCGTLLNNCPFCGGNATVQRRGSARQSSIITCDDCGCRMEANEEDWDTGHQWNKRIDEVSVLRAELERVKTHHQALLDATAWQTLPCDAERTPKFHDLLFIRMEDGAQHCGYFIAENEQHWSIRAIHGADVTLFINDITRFKIIERSTH